MGLEILEFETVGIALDSLASLMNQSCDPNTVYLFEGTTIRVRSFKPILIPVAYSMFASSRLK